jgi:hypothetical protein
MGWQRPFHRRNDQAFCCVARSQRELELGQMGRAEQYRWFAARCLEIAHTTGDAQTRAAMLQMAQVWSRLADETEPFGHEPPSGAAS